MSSNQVDFSFQIFTDAIPACLRGVLQIRARLNIKFDKDRPDR